MLTVYRRLTISLAIYLTAMAVVDPWQTIGVGLVLAGATAALVWWHRSEAT